MVTWFTPVRVSRGYMVCAMDSDRRKELTRLRQRRHTYHMSVPRSCENECCAIPLVAGSASFNAVSFLVIIIPPAEDYGSRVHNNYLCTQSINYNFCTYLSTRVASIYILNLSLTMTK